MSGPPKEVWRKLQLEGLDIEKTRLRPPECYKCGDEMVLIDFSPPRSLHWMCIPCEINLTTYP